MNDRYTPNEKNSLAYGWYVVPVFLLTISGLINFSYLGITHYQNFTDLTYSSFCALSKSINCDTVSQSKWSIFLGLPVAIWGLVGYLLFLLILVHVRRNSPISTPHWSLLLTLSLVFSAISVYFGYISTTQINAYCILCIIGYAISFGLLLYCWIIRRRFSNSSFFDDLKISFQTLITPLNIAGVFFLLAAICILQIYLPHYWLMKLPQTTNEIGHGFTETGHPWIGSDNPQITIEEFTDYQCFQCNKMHLFLRRLIAEYPDQIKLIHYHYPLDHEFNPLVVPEPFHIGSGKMALMAIYAAAENKFWEMNDALYTVGKSGQSFSTAVLAEKTGLTASDLALATSNPKFKELLLSDIYHGIELQITGTPTFVVNGQIYQGAIPKELLAEILE